jgi:hypothetical protein
MSLFDDASVVITPNGQKAGKLYSIKPTDGSGDLSVVRATSATRVDANGLVEIPRTNLVLQSQTFDNASWQKSNATVTANNTTAPDGTNTADKLIEDTANSSHYAFQNSSLVNANTYVASIYLKAAGRTRGRIRMSGSSAYWDLSFNLQDGTAEGPSLVSIQNVGNGWYRVSGVFVTNQVTNTMIISLSNSTSGNSGFNYIYTGNGVDGIFVWGAQVELGNALTEYIPTVASIRTKFAGITQDGSSASNIPRLDYTNGSCPSILVEPQRTNLVLRSEEFENAYWAKVQGGIALAPVVTANVETAPNGTTSADRIVFSLNGGTSSGDISQLESALFTSVSITRTQSFYIKTTDGTTKVFSFVSPTGVATNITVTSSYQRFTYTTTGINAGTIRLRLRGSASGEGTASSASIAIWGAQYEDGANATSYIPTTSASVTRNADVISKTGISSLIGQTEGTILIDLNLKVYSGIVALFTLSDGTSSNRLRARRTGVNLIALERNLTGQPNKDLAFTSAPSSGLVKVCFTWASTNNGLAIYVNGTKLALNEAIPTFTNQLTQFNLGSLQDGSSSLNDSINLATIWKTKLTDAECIQLTTI